MKPHCALLPILMFFAFHIPSGLAGVEFFPSPGAKNVCVDAPLKITFKDPPVIGSGIIKVIDTTDNSTVATVDVSAATAEQAIGGVPHFKYQPILIAGNVATSDLPNGSLAYGKTYSISTDAGAFKTDLGHTDWRFTTKAAAPAAGTAKLTIAADGSGDFCTLQGALDWIPNNNSNRITLFVRKGTYTELVNVRSKHAITITGEDRRQTVIAYANNANFNPSSDMGYHRSVFMAGDCNNLVISNLTIRNTTPRGGSQAEAIIINGSLTSRTIIVKVDLYSFQDTLQINGQTYLFNCHIEGDVDFMWGKGPCFFENCHCTGTRSKAYYAQVRNPPTNHGFVYHHCLFDGSDGVTGMYLNRIAPAGYPACEMVLIDCQLTRAVSPVGWLLNAATKGAPVPTTAPDVHFWEYNSHDADGKPIDISHRLNVSRQLQSPGDDELIKEYSQPSFVLGDHWEAQADPNVPGYGGK